jgi:hypothetical protein
VSNETPVTHFETEEEYDGETKTSAFESFVYSGYKGGIEYVIHCKREQVFDPNDSR